MNMSETLARRIAMATGREPADLRVDNARVVDVFSHTVLENVSLLIGDGVFLGFDGGEARQTVNAGSRYLLPGLVDAHVHIESSMLTPPQFARLVLPRGTTTVIADPHEIANVLGVAGIRYMLDSAASLPLDVYIMLPSCVPATPFEHAGAVIRAADLTALMDEPRVAGLGEMMNYPGVINADKDVLEKIATALRARKRVDGHAPGIAGQALDAYVCAGIRTDHECGTPEEMRDRLRRGMYVIIREGSAARNLSALIRGVTPGNAHRCLFCTDDRHPGDILAEGHMDNHLRLAVRHGLDPLLAGRMATLNAAQCYRLSHKGGIAPGLDADFLLVDDLREFSVREVYAKGVKIAENGALRVPIPADAPPVVTDTVRPAPLTPEALALALPTGRARVIGVQPRSLVTTALERTVVTTGGFFDAARNPGLTRIAVIERHKGTGHVGLGLLEGYVLPGRRLGGAIATTIAHDSHNIVAAGDAVGDILAAVEDLRRMGGGITLVRNGAVLDHLPLPVAGLMSDKTAEEISARMTALEALVRREFPVSPDVDPFMTLSFMALAVIPDLKLTDQGLFDVRAFDFVSVSVQP